MKTLKNLFILFLGLTFVTSCSDDDGPEPFVPTNSILEIAQASTDLTILEAALLKFPDLVTTLGGDGNFTVFAPNDAAFTALLAAIGQTSLDDIPEDVLRNILEYHVYDTAALPYSAISSTTIEMVNTENAEIVLDNDGSVTVANASVVAVDAFATNGVAHIIDSVMIPPSVLPIVGTIVAPAYFNKDFTTLIAAVNAADPSVLDLLISDGPNDNGYTLFAPTNAAFTAAGITDLSSVADIVDSVLQYHVIEGTVMAADLPDSGIAAAEVPTLGGNIYVTNAGSGVLINGTTEVVATDIMGSNGVVHVIDRTLIPPTQDIVEIVSEYAGGDSPEFTLLAAALTKAGLIDTFKGDGPFTVFAPTDAAFIAADIDQAYIDGAEAADLVPILTHHVVEPNAYVFSTDLVDGTVAMLNGTNVTIDTTNLTVQDSAGSMMPAGLVTTLLNVHATNGVIHVINKVLLPSSD